MEPLINLEGNLMILVFFFYILKHFTISSFINYSQLCFKKGYKKKNKREKNDGITWKNTTVKYSVTIASSCFFTA